MTLTQLSELNNQKCSEPNYQWQWQNEQLSRYEISRAIKEAEKILSDYLGYHPSEGYIENEEIPVALTRQDGYVAPQISISNHRWPASPPFSLKTQYGNVRKWGKRVLTKIASDVPIERYLSIPNSNNMGVLDNFRNVDPITVDAEYEPCRVHIFHAESIVGPAWSTDWEIRPVKANVTANGLLWDINFDGHAFLVAHPRHYVNVNPQGLMVIQNTSYADLVDVYVETFDTEQAGMLIWDDKCTATMDVLCPTELWAKQGIFTPHKINLETGEVIDFQSACSQLSHPNRVKVNYVSGCDCYSCPNDNQNTQCREAIMFLAAALLQCLPCGCACGKDGSKLTQYAEPPHYKTAASSRSFALTRMRDMEQCPFGPNWGAIKAWQIAKRIRKHQTTIL